MNSSVQREKIKSEPKESVSATAAAAAAEKKQKDLNKLKGAATETCQEALCHTDRPSLGSSSPTGGAGERQTGHRRRSDRTNTITKKPTAARKLPHVHVSTPSVVREDGTT